jgi:hypothetical protein
METRVFKLISQLGSVDLHLLLRPRDWVPKLREKKHSVAFHSNRPVLVVDSACLLEPLISRPRTQRPFSEVDLPVDKSGFLDVVLARVEKIEWSARLVTGIYKRLSPIGEDVVRRKTPVVRNEMRS